MGEEKGKTSIQVELREQVVSCASTARIALYKKPQSKIYGNNFIIWLESIVYYKLKVKSSVVYCLELEIKGSEGDKALED